VRSSKVTKRVCMARGRTPVKVWVGTLDEVDFLSPYIACFLRKQREHSKALVFC
jgi:hypothetical protein